ncbi:hypothetical protein [Maritimibacter sp. HL-12]|uniref:hypothetical protein n=1 Tax=Maritimibacter sp. HL-12 TaxID=1162418 RepID=UPI000A0F2E6B|nr:hypothetical protein [Maritimibacter sp. HL-12]SMH36298.1 hypothetical protein SAMN05661107_0721 [Maritimibacter sp. HL-12]
MLKTILARLLGGARSHPTLIPSPTADASAKRAPRMVRPKVFGFLMAAALHLLPTASTAQATVTCEGEWQRARLTNYESYPDPGSEECTKYNGCKWQGSFAGVNGKKSESWVAQRNIAAVHQKHWNQFRGKMLRLRQGGREIVVQVLDLCSDSDCNGCCTNNLGGDGYLIDIEKYTMSRFGSGSGVVDFQVCG